MNCHEVKDYLKQLVNFTDGEEETIEALCITSLKEIDSMLKPDADRSDIRLVAAAASKAYYKLMIKRNNTAADENIADFKAGDVSVTMQKHDLAKQLDEAEKFYEKTMQSILNLCSDDSFVFRQVHIK